MILTVLLILSTVDLRYAQEGDTCIKEGVPGVCTDLKQCPDALRKKPQHCVFGTRNAIVCCVSPVTTTTTTTTARPTKCILPPYPEHGSYTANVAVVGRVSPGDVHEFFVLNVTCDPGYSMDGPQLLFCRDGWWPEKMSNCISNSCTKAGVTGVCTKLKQCPAAREDIRKRIPPQHCWFGGVDAIVCCVPLPSAGTTTPIPTTTQRTQVSIPSSNNVDKENRDRCDPLPLSLSPKPTGQKAWDKCIEYQNKLVFPCGKNSRLGYSRSNRCHHHADNLLTGGVTAEPYEFPHTGLLGYGANPVELQWLCAGSLISEKFVLTAARCTRLRIGDDVKYVQLGILKSSELLEKDRYRVRRIINHPEYSPLSQYNDIALLELEKPVPLDEFIVPACVVTGTPVNDSLAIFTGWGSTNSKDSKPSDYLKKLVMTKFESQECAASYPPTRRMRNGIDERTQVCFGDKSTFANACLFNIGDVSRQILTRHGKESPSCIYRRTMEKGDAGGPLQIKNKQIACMYSVIGVFALSRWRCGGNASSYYPDVFTKVAPYVDWIESTVWL